MTIKITTSFLLGTIGLFTTFQATTANTKPLCPPHTFHPNYAPIMHPYYAPPPPPMFGMYRPAPYPVWYYTPAPQPTTQPTIQPTPPAQSKPVDRDHDKVVDSVDLCLDTPTSQAVNALGCPKVEPMTLHGVNFHKNADTLTKQSTAILDRVAKTLTTHPQVKLEISGHTDTDGNAAYNKDLSQRRAKTVKNYLVNQGINAELLTAKGYGEQQPIFPNDNAENKAKNRRVTLTQIN